MSNTFNCQSPHCFTCSESPCPLDNEQILIKDLSLSINRRKSNEKAKEKAKKNADFLCKRVAETPISDKPRRKRAYRKAHIATRKVH